MDNPHTIVKMNNLIKESNRLQGYVLDYNKQLLEVVAEGEQVLNDYMIQRFNDPEYDYLYDKEEDVNFVLGLNDCDKSPFGLCVYEDNIDSSHEYCFFCEPERE